MSTVIIFLVVIVFLVVAHELGHFFVAKAFSIRVDEFGVGYPPRAKKLFTWKKTLFTLNWLPFGGFVKIFGEELTTDGEMPEEGTPGSFAYQKKWKRVLVIAAGILANFLLAIVLYAFSYGIGFLGAPSDFPGSTQLGPSETLITSTVDHSPASGAGILAGDILTKLTSGKDIETPQSVTDVITFVRSHGTAEITLSIKHKGIVSATTLTPKVGIDGNTYPSIGITLAEVAPLRVSPIRAIGMGITNAGAEFWAVIVGLGGLIKSSFGGGTSLISQVSGPVGIAQYAGQAFALGFGSFLSFVALISINLAVINLLPFPALDGGRIVIELFSSKGKSKIPARVIMAINQIGFILLIILMLYVTYHDIVKLFV